MHIKIILLKSYKGGIAIAIVTCTYQHSVNPERYLLHLLVEQVDVQLTS